MLSCPSCTLPFDQKEHLPVVGVLFSSKTICLSCHQNKCLREINGQVINEGYLVNYKVKETVEKYNEENGLLIELQQKLREKRRQWAILEEKLNHVMEKKAAILEETNDLQNMRKEEDPTCTEWDPCFSCNIFTNSDKLLNCQICNDSKPICATCIIQHHKHVINEVDENGKKAAPILDKTIDLDISSMSICENSPNLSDSAIYLYSDHTVDDSVIIID